MDIDGITLKECLGLNHPGSGLPKNVVVNTSSAVISSAGVGNLPPGLSVTINLQEQLIHRLHETCIGFTANLTNGYVESGLSLVESK